MSCLESTSSADVDRDLSVLGLEYRPSAQFVVPSLRRNGRGQLTFRPGDPHTQNKRVSGPLAENRQKMWCKCGAGRSQTRCERPNSASRSATSWTFFGADDGIRTRDPHLGKVMLYQLSHVRLLRRHSSNLCNRGRGAPGHRPTRPEDDQAQCPPLRTAAFRSSPKESDR